MGGSFTIDLSAFSPGPHSLSVTATSDDGEDDSADTIFFTVPEPLGNFLFNNTIFLPTDRLTDCADVRCSSAAEVGVVTITCEASNPLSFPSECVLSGTDTTITFPCEFFIEPVESLSLLHSLPLHAGNASDIVLDVGDYPPGEYNLTVRVQDENGQTTSTEVESISLTGLFAHCSE